MGDVSRISQFLAHIRRCAKLLNIMGRDDPIYIFSHIDADGISSAAIMLELLLNLNRPLILRFIPQIVPSVIDEIIHDIKPMYLVFMDLGTDIPLKIAENLKTSRVLIIDHHILSGKKIEHDIDAYVLNPRDFKIEGGIEISSSGVTYLLAKMFSQKIKNIEKMATLAVVGAVGDAQDVGAYRSIVGLNRLILDDGKKAGYIDYVHDILMYGRGIKPLYRLLAETYLINVPGVTGSYDGALDFLRRTGIIKGEDDIESIYLDDLTERKRDFLRKKLIEIIMTQYPGRYTIEDIENLLTGEIYVFLKEERRPFRYARDLAMLLNACGKMRNPDLAMRAILNPKDRKALGEILNMYDRYRAIISSVLRQVDDKVEIMKNIAILNLGDMINEEITGTLASILSTYFSSKCDIVMVIAKSIDNVMKVSLRKTIGSKIRSIMPILSKCLESMREISGGGHESAAGLYVREDLLSAFIEKFAEYAGVQQ